MLCTLYNIPPCPGKQREYIQGCAVLVSLAHSYLQQDGNTQCQELQLYVCHSCPMQLRIRANNEGRQGGWCQEGRGNLWIAVPESLNSIVFHGK